MGYAASSRFSFEDFALRVNGNLNFKLKKIGEDFGER